MKLTVYALTALLSLSLLSCHTEKGDPGPAGTSDLQQQGTINGTLSYDDGNDKPVSKTFDYQYYRSDVNENSFTFNEDTTRYIVNLTRYASTDSDDNYLQYSFSGDINNDTALAPTTSMSISFNYAKDNSNELYIFKSDENAYFTTPDYADGNSTIDFTNYSFDIKTGLLKFNYTISYDNEFDINSDYANDFNTTPTIKGVFSVKLKHNPFYPTPK